MRWTSAVVGAVLIQAALPQALASASPQTCGTSGTVQICMSVPSDTLNGFVQVTASGSTGSANVQFSWAPTSGHCVPGFSGTCHLTMQFGQDPGTTNDYSFTWPTQKYLDGAGSLQAHVGNASVVALPGLTLSNGNASAIQESPSDWATFLPPTTWSGATDPTVVAVGDGAVNQKAGNDVATSIAQTGPPLLLYLGDLYEDGTSTEALNHYGWNAMDGPCPLSTCSSLAPWGSLGAVTQPTIGNHEYQAAPATDGSAWVDYWHQRPLYTSFVFANALFIDLNCGPSGGSCDVGTSSDQYAYVNSLLGGPHPPCVVTYWHIPALSSDKVVNNLLPIWKLLADGGGTLVLNGHVHSMQISRPLNDKLLLPTSGEPTMTEIISGAGGHGVGAAKPLGSRMLWTKGGTPGALYLTLNGAANGGTPTSISYGFEGTNHAVLTNSTGTPGSGTLPCTSAPPPPPTISSFSPTSGPAGTPVTIDGTDFTGASDVRFNGLTVGAGNFTVNSSIQITATVPSAATTGLVSVVTSGGTATSAGTFVVTLPQPPTITGFSPPSGPVGTPVTINGTNFTGASDVRFNGLTVGAGNFTESSSIQITATVPSAATDGLITVLTPGGTATSTGTFVVTAPSPPTISSFSPTSGPVGTPVTINGTNFTGASEVRFNGLTVGAGNFTVNSSIQITATVPSAATDGLITVLTPGGTATSTGTFVVTSPQLPTITGFSPTSGPIGTVVTITGSGFTGAFEVKFSGVKATFIVNSDTTITATVPAKAKTGKIVVRTPAGNATSLTKFTV